MCVELVAHAVKHVTNKDLVLYFYVITCLFFIISPTLGL